MYAFSPRARTTPAERFAGFGAVLAIHVAAIAVLLQFEGVRRAVVEAAPIMVSLINLAPSVSEAPKPVAKAPAPRPAPPVAVPEAPKPVETPAPLAANVAAPTAPAVAEPARPAPAPVASVAPVVPPSFNADYLNNPAPGYPALSRRYREQGRVLLRVYVSAAGAAEKVEVETSSGFPRLDDAALEAVRAWRFVPASQGEKRVAAWVNVPLRFSLEGAP